MEKKLKGYKLKTKFLNYDKVCNVITNGWWERNAEMNLTNDGCNFVAESIEGCGIESKFSNLGLLSEWFIPVYEETSKFKIGDWVVWTLNGYVGKITAKCSDYDDSWNLRPDGVNDGEYSSCSENYLRLATPEEIEFAHKPRMFVNGNLVGFHKNHITIGAYEISKETFLKLFNTLSFLTDIGSNKLGNINIGDITFTEKQILEIAGFFLKRKTNT